MKKIVSLLIVTLFFLPSIATIIESDDFTLIAQYAHTNTLVVLDIDNTLARTETELGSDEWFCHLVDQKIAAGNDYLSAIYLALPLAYYAQFNLHLKLTDPILTGIFDYLKKENIDVIALTSRGLFLAERTHEQLKSIGLEFHTNETLQDEYILPLEHPCLWKYHMIFTGNNNKGDTLLCFFDMIENKPSFVIFIDDKMSHVIAVEKALNANNIENVCIRYTGCDRMIHNFDPAKADAQLIKIKENNHNILTEALEIFLEHC